MAEKLIPGIPEETRIAILQQTRLTDDADHEEGRDAGLDSEASVLRQVIDKATARDTVEEEIKGMFHVVDDTHV